ncbi:MAG TPA: hypothetical protein VN879_08105 [Candidatus Acidoferrales bacterium]|nr:hypothetical protein [Candidatus Acidoferrales bacterium]
MTKLRIQVALFMFVLAAAVAVFSNAGTSETITRSQANTRSSFSDKAVVLTADGGDPVPRPPTALSLVGLTA